MVATALLAGALLVGQGAGDQPTASPGPLPPALTAKVFFRGRADIKFGIIRWAAKISGEGEITFRPRGEVWEVSLDVDYRIPLPWPFKDIRKRLREERTLTAAETLKGVDLLALLPGLMTADPSDLGRQSLVISLTQDGFTIAEGERPRFTGEGPPRVDIEAKFKASYSQLERLKRKGKEIKWEDIRKLLCSGRIEVSADQ